jgi:hypothetical protein
MVKVQMATEPLRTQLIIGFDLFRISNDGKSTEMWQQFTSGRWS